MGKLLRYVLVAFVAALFAGPGVALAVTQHGHGGGGGGGGTPNPPPSNPPCDSDHHGGQPPPYGGPFIHSLVCKAERGTGNATGNGTGNTGNGTGHGTGNTTGSSSSTTGSSSSTTGSSSSTTGSSSSTTGSSSSTTGTTTGAQDNICDTQGLLPITGDNPPGTNETIGDAIGDAFVGTPLDGTLVHDPGENNQFGPLSTPLEALPAPLGPEVGCLINLIYLEGGSGNLPNGL